MRGHTPPFHSRRRDSNGVSLIWRASATNWTFVQWGPVTLQWWRDDACDCAKALSAVAGGDWGDIQVRSQPARPVIAAIAAPAPHALAVAVGSHVPILG